MRRNAYTWSLWISYLLHELFDALFVCKTGLRWVSTLLLTACTVSTRAVQGLCLACCASNSSCQACPCRCSVHIWLYSCSGARLSYGEWLQMLRQQLVVLWAIRTFSGTARAMLFHSHQASTPQTASHDFVASSACLVPAVIYHLSAGLSFT